VSLYVDDAGTSHLAYINQTDETLEYAYPASDGNCGLGAWQCDVIQDVGPNASDLDIVEDTNGYPMIAYQSTVSGTALMLARPNAALGWLNGNCGPGVFPYFSWTCEYLHVNPPSTSIAGSVVLATSPSGDAAIAYTKSTIYTRSLLAAFEDGFAIYKDRFETGSTNWWNP
jgi:hypothetical protein